MRKVRTLLSLLLPAMLVLTMVPMAASAQGKTVVIDLVQEPDTLNPYYSNMWFARILQELYLLGPWSFDENLEPVPRLVTEIPSRDNGGINEDGTVITLRLRDDLVWSDGEPLTSEDFVFTHEMVIDPANAVSTRDPYGTVITSVEAPDAQTVVVTFSQPYAPWLANLFTGGVLPKHVLQPVFEADGTIDGAAWNRTPSVGSGPFVGVEWESGSHILFERNENWFDGAANLDSIFVRVGVDDNAQVADLVSGNADIGTFFDNDAIPVLEEAGVDTFVVASGYNEGWYFNVRQDGTGHPALQDVRVRRALVMAFDRWTIVNEMMPNTHVVNSFWDGTPYANPDLEPIPYDPEGAAALLEEAGWVDTNGDGCRDKDGEELVLSFVTNQRGLRLAIAPVVQQQLGEVGACIELFNYTSDQFFGTYAEGGITATGQFDIAEWSNNPNWPDPNTTQWRCFEIATDENPAGINDQQVCDERLEALFEAEVVEVDPEARAEIYHQIDQILQEELYWVGVLSDADNWAVNPRVINARISGVGQSAFWNAHEWDIAG
ncbi:MAG: peptide ABC transporter substrate-binding protein [Anaerolineae bacterium]